MYNWFEQMLAAFTREPLGTNSLSQRSCDFTETKQKESPNPTSEFETKFAKDISALCHKFGALCRGDNLEISLKEMLRICPRHRQRCDAYNSLIKGLKDDLGVSLTIKSRKQNNLLKPNQHGN